MNFKDSEFFLLVVAFLVGYFFQTIMKGCNVVEGVEGVEGVEDPDLETRLVSLEARVVDLETTRDSYSQFLTDYKFYNIFKTYDDNFEALKTCHNPLACGMKTASKFWPSDI